MTDTRALMERLKSAEYELRGYDNPHDDDMADLFREAIAALTAAQAREARLEAAILWALGEGDEFGEEPPPLAGKYRRPFWWREELRRRAFDAALSETETPHA